jgi:hypothetical protein
MKIACLIPAYATFSFIAVCAPTSAVYLSPWLDVFQSVSLGYFFLLLCEFVSPNREQRDLFFAALHIRDKKAPGQEGGGLKWYRVRPSPGPPENILVYARIQALTTIRDDGSCCSNILSLPSVLLLVPTLPKRPVFTANMLASPILLIFGYVRNK